jgi:dipeptidyl aminopeptidase/acylaminoacyl peptidase
MLASYVDAPKLDKERIGLFGFSMGGYTGLVVLGAVPDFRRGLPGCAGPSFSRVSRLSRVGFQSLPQYMTRESKPRSL